MTCVHASRFTPMTNTLVLKIGGNELDSPAFLEGLCAEVAALRRPTVLVHGGGKEITAALEHFGQKSSFIDGLRVTPPESMAVMEMVVCGRINKRIVAKLVTAGVRAVGMSGVDLGLLRCIPYRPNNIDLGRVGAITEVDKAALGVMLGLDWLPVLAPVALGVEDGAPYNVNADLVAQAVAIALGAVELAFVSNVPGVLVDDQVIPLLRPSHVRELIASGIISGGMIPKVMAASAALDAGVAATRITNLSGLRAGGTRIEPEE